MKRLILTFGFLAVLSPMVHADGDAAKGARTFRACGACHTAEAETNKVGPYLKGVVGRKAGTVPSYTYSPAMKAKGEEGLVWTETNLDTYLTNPREFVAGNKMAFPGLKKADDRADVIAYLKSKM